MKKNTTPIKVIPAMKKNSAVEVEYLSKNPLVNEAKIYEVNIVDQKILVYRPFLSGHI